MELIQRNYTNGMPDFIPEQNALPQLANVSLFFWSKQAKILSAVFFSSLVNEQGTFTL